MLCVHIITVPTYYGYYIQGTEVVLGGRSGSQIVNNGGGGSIVKVVVWISKIVSNMSQSTFDNDSFDGMRLDLHAWASAGEGQ